jgi:hypothetical protein
VPRDEVLSLVVVAVIGAAAEIMAASSGQRELGEYLNQELRHAGLELRPVPRNGVGGCSINTRRAVLPGGE